MIQVIDNRQVTARKTHHCFLCRQDILPKEKYNHQAVASEGSVDTLKTHLYCDAVLNEHWDSWYHTEGYGPDHFDEDMSEAWGEAERLGSGYPWLVKGWDSVK